MSFFKELISQSLQAITKSIPEVSETEAFDVVATNAAENMPDITINRQIRNRYRNGWINRTRSKNPTEVVIHGTAGGASDVGLLRWMYNGERAKEYMRGEALFHYLVGMDGSITEVIDPEYWVYHSSSGKHDKETIGIELINPSKINDIEYTPEQYKALFDLIKYLMQIFPISSITSHRYNLLVYNRKTSSSKQCPGTGFSWEKVDEFLIKNNYSYQTDGNLRYNIQRG
jgi:hypothetical protein